MQQKAVETQTDLTKAYQPASKLPLGSEPKLITKVSFITIGSSQINMQFALKNQAPIDLELNITTLSSIRLLLNELNKKAFWNLNDEHEAAQDTKPAPHVIH